MPTAARAKTTKQATKKPAAVPKPPRPSRRSGPQPLKQAKIAACRLQRLGLPLPQRRSRHRQAVPRCTRRPQARPHQRRAATSIGNSPPTATAARCIYLPAGYDPQRPSLIVLFLHGQGATLERDVIARQAVPRQTRRVGAERGAGGAAAGRRCRRFERRQLLEAGPFRRLHRRGGGAADAALWRPPRRFALQPGAGRDGGLQRRLSLGCLCAGTRRRRPSHQGRDPDGCALRRRGQVRRPGWRRAAASRSC